MYTYGGDMVFFEFKTKFEINILFGVRSHIFRQRDISLSPPLETVFIEGIRVFVETYKSIHI